MYETQLAAWGEFLSTHYGPGTARTYKSRLCTLLAWLGDRPLTQHAIEDFITHTLVVGGTRASVNVAIAAVKQFCRWHCPRAGIEDPSTHIAFFGRAECKPRRQRFVTPDEYTHIVATAAVGVERDTVEFLGNTGLRREEYVKLTAACIGASHLSVVGKRRKSRQVPSNSVVKDIIARSRFADTGELRCVTYWQGNADNIYRACQCLARRAQVPAFGPHALRHYFATALIRRGVPLKIVSQILGHSSVLITEHTYCHLTDADTAGVTECLCRPL